MGLPFAQTPLGETPDGLDNTITIEPKRRRPARAKPLPKVREPVAVDAPASAEGEVPEAAQDPAPDRLPEAAPGASPPHRLVERTIRKLAASKGDGLISISGKAHFRVTACSRQADRVGQVISLLINAVKAQGWKVGEGEAGLQLEPDGEAVSFSLVEQTDKQKHAPTAAELAALDRFEANRQRAVKLGRYFSEWDRPKVPEWDYIPNGRFVLSFELGYRSDRIRRKFSDGKTQRLETLVDDMVQSLAAYAAAEKAARIRREEYRLAAIEAEKRAAAERRHRELENKRYEFLKAQMSRLATARDIESFVSELEKERPSEGALALFLRWAEGLAAALRSEISQGALSEKLERHDLMNDEAEIYSWSRVD